MARKSIPARPARDRSREEESLLLRSAESLGRMIGSLQRQLELATGRLAASKPNGMVRGSAAAERRAKTQRGAMARGGATKNVVRGSASKNNARGARKRSGAVKSAARKSAKKR